jgi:hypothetical protein
MYLPDELENLYQMSANVERQIDRAQAAHNYFKLQRLKLFRDKLETLIDRAENTHFQGAA